MICPQNSLLSFEELQEVRNLFSNGNISGYSFDSMLFLCTSDTDYYQTIVFDKVSYRDNSGNILTLCQNMTNQTAYGGTGFDDQVYTYTGIPNQNSYGYYNGEKGIGTLASIDSLIGQDKTQPYLSIVISNPRFIDSTRKTSYIPINMTWRRVGLSGVRLIRDHANSCYILELNAQYATKFEVDVVRISDYEEEKVYKTLTVSDLNVKTMTIPESYFVDGNNRLDIRVWNGNQLETTSKTFTHNTPAINNLNVINSTATGDNLIDNITTISFESKNQNTAELYDNDVLIARTSTVTSFIFPKGQFTVGKHNFRVRVYNQGDSNVENSRIYVESIKTVTFSRIAPTIVSGSFVLSGNNIDEAITAEWEATNQSRYDIVQDGSVIYSGGTEQSISFPPGTFKVAVLSKVKLVVWYDSGFDSVSSEQVLDKLDFICNAPYSTYLEPSDVYIDITASRSLTFKTSLYVTDFTLILNFFILFWYDR